VSVARETNYIFTCRKMLLRLDLLSITKKLHFYYYFYIFLLDGFTVAILAFAVKTYPSLHVTPYSRDIYTSYNNPLLCCYSNLSEAYKCRPSRRVCSYTPASRYTNPHGGLYTLNPNCMFRKILLEFSFLKLHLYSSELISSYCHD